MKPIIQHFTDNDAYTFSCQYYVMQTYPQAEVEYSFKDRNDTIYPEGFAEKLRAQIDSMQNVVITDEEIAFMKQRMYYLPEWYFTFLRGYRFKPAEVQIDQDAAGHLQVSVRGKWWSTIMWEMPILCCVSELMHEYRGDVARYSPWKESVFAEMRAEEILLNGLKLADMGTRRRFSFEHHERVIRAFMTVQVAGA